MRKNASIAAAFAIGTLAGFGGLMPNSTDVARAQTPSEKASGVQMGESQKAKEQRSANQAVRFSGQPWRTKTGRRSGPGWTQAQVKRMARKKRNVARNRKAHR